MKENGKKENDKELGLKSMKMEIAIKVSSFKENLKEKEFSFGEMEKYTKESFMRE